MADVTRAQSRLNEKFFKDMDTKLIERMRAEAAELEQIKALGEVTGIEDQGLLKELFASGVTSETMTAFRMVPLIAVAWSDSVIQDKERVALLKAAAENGIVQDSPSYTLLQSWLKRKLPDDLLEAWKAYVAALAESITPVAMLTLKSESIGGARRIAEAAGGFLGLGTISDSEMQVIENLETAFRE